MGFNNLKGDKLKKEEAKEGNSEMVRVSGFFVFYIAKCLESDNVFMKIAILSATAELSGNCRLDKFSI